MKNRRVSSRGLLLGAMMAACASLAGALPAQAEGLLDKIKERGEIVVATEAAFEPFEFIEDGEIVGYHKDILDHVVSELGVELKQLDLPFQGLLPGLLAGKFDLVATATIISPERAARYAYTHPLGTAVNMIVVRAGETRIERPADLDGKVVATQLASAAQDVIEDYDRTLKENGGSGVEEIKLFTSFPETHVALASGQVDAIAIPSPTAAVLLRNVPGTFKAVGPINDPRYFSWIVRPDSKDLRDFINAKVDELRASGKLKELQLKWLGFEMDLPSEGYLPEGAQ